MMNPTEPEDQHQFEKVVVTTASDRDPLEVVLSDFTEEIRLGRSPSIADYTSRYPQFSEQIRELFPLIVGIESWKDIREMECIKRNIPADFSIERLGEYHIVRELGRGGMGVVFEAVHEVSQWTVAIKLLPCRFAANMLVWKERLQKEAATIAALRHPNIVPIYSFSEDQGYPYYVMQLIDGIGLDRTIQRLKQNRDGNRQSRIQQPAEETTNTLTHDSWRGFAKIGERVALALAYAHDCGVLHNDIKPSNLLIRPNRQVIITDFGIGLQGQDEVSDTHEGAIGTLKYMAPERLKGTGSPQSDIYSLGATLYELATKVPIFDVEKKSLLIDAIQNVKPTSPRQIVPDIPEPFEAIILKAISKSPKDRYASANELADDLRRFINRQPILARETTIVTRVVAACLKMFSRQNK